MASKKRSGSKPPPENPVFFMDRSLGRHAGRTLAETGAHVTFHDDLFAQDTLDEDLLPEIGRRNWIFVTKDKRIRFRQNEVAAVMEHRLRVFVLAAAKNLTGADMGKLLVKHRARMERLARKTAAPFIAGVYETGVRLLDIKLNQP